MDAIGCCGMLPDSTQLSAFVIASGGSNRPVEVGIDKLPYPKKRLKIR